MANEPPKNGGPNYAEAELTNDNEALKKNRQDAVRIIIMRCAQCRWADSSIGPHRCPRVWRCPDCGCDKGECVLGDIEGGDVDKLNNVEALSYEWFCPDCGAQEGDRHHEECAIYYAGEDCYTNDGCATM